MKFIKLAKNYYYQVPTSAKERMMDFYLLTWVHSMTEKLRPNKQQDNLKESVEEAVIKLTTELKKELLNVLLIGINAEFRHIFDSNTTERISFYYKNRPEWKQIRDYLSKTLTMRNQGNPFSEEARTIDKKTREFNEVASSTDYARQFAIFLESGVPDGILVKCARDAFTDLRWGSAFGGEKWAGICNGWINLANAKDTNNLIVWIDHIYDLQHNTGSALNKVKAYSDDYGEDWVKESLDFKKHVVNPWELLEQASPSAQQMSRVVLTGAGVKPPEDDSWTLEEVTPASNDKNNAESNPASPSFWDDPKNGGKAKESEPLSLEVQKFINLGNKAIKCFMQTDTEGSILIQRVTFYTSHTDTIQPHMYGMMYYIMSTPDGKHKVVEYSNAIEYKAFVKHKNIEEITPQEGVQVIRNMEAKAKQLNESQKTSVPFTAKPDGPPPDLHVAYIQSMIEKCTPHGQIYCYREILKDTTLNAATQLKEQTRITFYFKEFGSVGSGEYGLNVYISFIPKNVGFDSKEWNKYKLVSSSNSIPFANFSKNVGSDTYEIFPKDGLNEVKEMVQKVKSLNATPEKQREPLPGVEVEPHYSGFVMSGFATKDGMIVPEVDKNAKIVISDEYRYFKSYLNSVRFWVFHKNSKLPQSGIFCLSKELAKGEFALEVRESSKAFEDVVDGKTESIQEVSPQEIKKLLEENGMGYAINDKATTPAPTNEDTSKGEDTDGADGAIKFVIQSDNLQDGAQVEKVINDNNLYFASSKYKSMHDIYIWEYGQEYKLIRTLHLVCEPLTSKHKLALTEENNVFLIEGPDSDWDGVEGHDNDYEPLKDLIDAGNILQIKGKDIIKWLADNGVGDCAYFIDDKGLDAAFPEDTTPPHYNGFIFTHDGFNENGQKGKIVLSDEYDYYEVANSVHSECPDFWVFHKNSNPEDFGVICSFKHPDNSEIFFVSKIEISAANLEYVQTLASSKYHKSYPISREKIKKNLDSVGLGHVIAGETTGDQASLPNNKDTPETPAPPPPAPSLPVLIDKFEKLDTTKTEIPPETKAFSSVNWYKIAKQQVSK